MNNKQSSHFVINFFSLIIPEEAETYRRIRKTLQTPTEIMEVFKALIFTKDNVQPLIDGSTNKMVCFFFCSLAISSNFRNN